MKIDVSKIDGFENLTDAEKISALTNFEFEDNSKQIDELKKIISSKNSESAEWKKKYNSTLTEQEQQKIEIDERIRLLEEENKALKQSQQLASMTAKYIKLGYDENLAKDTAQAVIDNKFDVVIANQEKFNQQREQNLKAEITKSNPRPSSVGGGSTILTKKDIMNIKDTTERQKAIAENIELFEKGD